jgi:hypothetical protein
MFKSLCASCLHFALQTKYWDSLTVFLRVIQQRLITFIKNAIAAFEGALDLLYQTIRLVASMVIVPVLLVTVRALKK